MISSTSAFRGSFSSSSPLSSPPTQVLALLGDASGSTSPSVHGKDTSATSSDEDAFLAPPSAQPSRSSIPAQRAVSPGRSSAHGQQRRDLLRDRSATPSSALTPRNGAQTNDGRIHRAFPAELTDRGGTPAFTGSQLCLNLIEPELRTAYTVAYRTAKDHVEAGTLPDWDVVWYENSLSSYDPDVRALIRHYFDGVIQAYLARAASTTNSSMAVPARSTVGPPSLSASRPPEPSPASDRRSLSGSASGALLPINMNTSRTSNTTEPRLTLSTTPRKAVAKGGEWRGFDYVGVVRWRKGGVEEKVITYTQWCQEHEEPGPKAGVATRGSGKGKGKTTDTGATARTDSGAKPSRARQYDAYRERWECRTCLSQLHEGVGRTGNLTKHRAKCDAAARAAG
ncbi:hypothetical protein OC835_005466 [Tilletia horrida]|nr:hypothetical protein OC835_005466 [Tilletia horrida]